MRNIDFSDLAISDMGFTIVSMEEAITAYRNGSTVGILNHHLASLRKVLAMDKYSNFTTDLDFLVNSQWVILN